MPNVHKIHQMFQMGIQYTNIFRAKALQNIPELGF
jgi:hypothetical protein